MQTGGLHLLNYELLGNPGFRHSSSTGSFFILMGATWMLQIWIKLLCSRIWFSLCLLLKASLLP